jgi:hypothetical protein
MTGAPGVDDVELVLDEAGFLRVEIATTNFTDKRHCRPVRYWPSSIKIMLRTASVSMKRIAADNRRIPVLGRFLVDIFL